MTKGFPPRSMLWRIVPDAIYHHGICYTISFTNVPKEPWWESPRITDMPSRDAEGPKG